MTSDVRLAMDEATQAQIADHLRACAGDFVPPLADRVDIDEYADKIGSLAVRFEAWADDALIGLVAVYANDPARDDAFVSSVSVTRDHQRHGIATVLLARSVEHTRRQGFKRLTLEVERGNAGAVRLYSNAGFAMERAHGRMTRMALELQRRGNTESEP
jgi:GNAT superfamily N-acetyltransferase